MGFVKRLFIFEDVIQIGLQDFNLELLIDAVGNLAYPFSPKALTFGVDPLPHVLPSAED